MFVKKNKFSLESPTTSTYMFQCLLLLNDLNVMIVHVHYLFD